jgi:hypothetical protein
MNPRREPSSCIFYHSCIFAIFSVIIFGFFPYFPLQAVLGLLLNHVFSPTLIMDNVSVFISIRLIKSHYKTDHPILLSGFSYVWLAYQ